MEPFKRILVDVDSTASAHPALERAVLLARSSGASLTITDVMTDPTHARRYLPAALEEEIARGRRQQLANVANLVTDVQAEPKLLIGRPATVLVQEVLRSNHDLLMRSHARDSSVSSSKGFGAVDMELLRNCPCPVLLVRHGSAASHPQIAGAVNASTVEEEEEALNTKIVELMLQMADHLKARSMRLLHAWTPAHERAVRRYSTDDQFAIYEEGSRQRATADLDRLVRSFEGRLTESQSALRRGKPQDVIPEFVVAEGVDLIVMGTAARAGIAGLLIGNTAERVLRKLPCSVLVVKPDGFVSPVRLDAP